MKLRSVNLRMEDIPDLNLNDEPNGVSSEGGGEGCEVRKTKGMSNVDVCEGLKVENVVRVEGQMSNVCEISKNYCAEIDVVGEEKVISDIGLVNEGQCLKSEATEEGLDVGKSRENCRKEILCEDEKGANLEGDDAICEKSPCQQGVAASGTDDKQTVSLIRSEDDKHNREDKRVPIDCDSDLVVPLKSGSGTGKNSHETRSVFDSSEGKIDEADQIDRLKEEVTEGSIQVFGKILRSRTVSANELGEEAGEGRTRASHNKRKRETGPGKAAVTMEDEVGRLLNDLKMLGSSGSLKRSADLSNGEVVELSNVQLVSKTYDEGVHDMSCSFSSKNMKGGRPQRETDHSDTQTVNVHQPRDVSEIENKDLDERPTLNTKKDRRKVVCKGEDEAGEVEKSVGSSTQRYTSERSKRRVDYCENEAVRRRKLSGCKMEAVSEDKNIGLSNMKVASSKIKAKRGRPRKQEGGSPVKMIPHDNDTNDDGKIKASLITHRIRQRRQETDNNGKATDGVSNVQTVSSASKKPSGGIELHTACTSDNNQSVKRKWGETPGSLAAEKNLIKNQIVDILLCAGWTVEHRPRNGREYLDAVYVTPEGKTHWSVTKAYSFLQKEFKEGKTDSISTNSEFSFTPLPEEALNKLYRRVSKTRSDKNTKKMHNGATRVKHGSKGGVKSNSSALKRKPSVRHGTPSKRRCGLLARRSKGLNSEDVEAISYYGKHSILAWLIDSAVISVDDKVRYMNRRRTRTMLEGNITRDGIHCHCCKEVFSVTQFEKHGGCKLDQPYENSYLESGRSLLQCLLESWNKQDAASLNGFCSVNVDADDPSDDTCVICGDGGDLMCCDGCPSTFHHDCLDIEEVPSGEWYCFSCSCKLCGGAESASSSLVTCCLCEQKYHQSCADEENFVHNKSGLATVCGKNCEQIFDQLQALIGTKSDLGDGFSWTLLQRFDAKGEADSLEAEKIRNNSKLAVALSVMDECFVPIIDPRSGVNLIRHVVYNSGSNLRRLNFRSFFTIVLEKGNEVISAATIRVHGKQLAEMPFIGTRNIYRRQGMCRRLLAAVELALSSLDVENLVIPAIPELLDTWTSIFGFQPLKESIRKEMRSMNLLVFAHTDMLQKPLSNHNLDEGIATIEKDGKCAKSSNELFDGGAEKSEVDDGCFRGSFDLNVVAPGIPESSSDETLASSNAEDCADDVKSGVDSVRLYETDNVDGQPTPMEITDDRAHNSTLVVNTSDGCMIPDHSKPSCDETAETTINSCGLVKLDMLSTRGIVHGHTKAAPVKPYEGMTLNPDLNLTELEDNVSPHNDSCHRSFMDSDKSEDAPSGLSQPNSSAVDTSGTTVHISAASGNASVEEKVVPMSEIHETNTPNSHSATAVEEKLDLNASVEEKVGSKSKIHETSVPVSHNATGVSSNDSMMTAAESIECSESDSHVVLTSVRQVSSGSSCNMGTAVGETNSTGLYLGSGVSKVGSN